MRCRVPARRRAARDHDAPQCELAGAGSRAAERSFPLTARDRPEPGGLLGAGARARRLLGQPRPQAAVDQTDPADYSAAAIIGRLFPISLTARESGVLDAASRSPSAASGGM